jgi:hypothetical protein
MTVDELIPEHSLAQFRAGLFARLSWLLEIILRIGVFSRSRRLKRMVRNCERRVACIYFLAALRRLGHAPQQRAASSAAPPGFRRTRSRGRLLLKRAGPRDKSGNLAQRVRRLVGALNQPERYIARVLKRLARGVCLSHLVVAAPSAAAMVCVTLAAAHADSS